MKLVDISHPALLKKAKKVGKIDSKIKKIIADMKDVLRKSDIGIGLAAPQVGISLQIFLVSPDLPDAKDKHREPIDVYINPIVVEQSKPANINHKKTLEGCLSIPEFWGPVARSKKITIKYTDEYGQEQTKKFDGFTATIIQHEIDHLQGILFTHRVLEQEETLYRSEGDELVPVDI